MKKSYGFSRRTLFLLPSFFMAGAIFYVSSLPDIELPLDSVSFNDLLFHFGAYFSLGLTMLTAAYPWQGSHAYPLRTCALLAGIGILYALSDEIHQSFVPNRSCTISDFLADSLGVVSAQASGVAWLRKRRLPL